MKKNLWNLYETETLNQIGTISQLQTEHSSIGLTSKYLKNLTAQISSTSELIAKNSSLESMNLVSNLFEKTSLSQVETISQLIAKYSNTGLTSKLLSEHSSLASMNLASNLFERTSLGQVETVSQLIAKYSNTLEYSDLVRNSTAQIGTIAKLMAENSTIGLTSELVAKQSSLFGYSNSIEQIGAMAKLMAENSTIGLTSELIAKQISLIKNNTILDKDIENINDTDEKIISQIAEVILHFFPELNTIKNTLSKKQYFKMSIYLIIYLSQFYLSVLGTLSLFEDKSLNSYIINRNNVLVKSEPSTENSESIIELNKNYYVKKIDSYKNWIKVEFENENSELLEGWIRNDMLRKIEN